MFIDFNLRNLSISFFVKASTMRNTKNDEKNEVFFVELESLELTAKENQFKNPEHIELLLKPSRFQVLDKNNRPVQDFSAIESILLVTSEKHKLFMSVINPLYKSRTPMQMPMDNMTDQESIISFHTNIMVSQEEVKVPELLSQENLPVVISLLDESLTVPIEALPVKVNEQKKQGRTVEQTNRVSLKSEPLKEIATQNQPIDSEGLPPADQFSEKKQNEQLEKPIDNSLKGTTNDGVSNKAPIASTKRSIFDNLLAPLTSPAPISAEESVKVTKASLKRRSRVSFDETVRYIKRTRSSSYESEPVVQEDCEEVENGRSFVPLTQAAVPSPQRPVPEPQHNNTVVFNLKALENNQLLGQYINDTMTNQANQEDYDEMVITNTRRIQKTSPTTIRTIQYQEISISPPQVSKTVAKVSNAEEDTLCRLYKEKTGEALQPLIKELRKIKNSSSLAEIKPESLAKVRQAMEESRTSKERCRTHVLEHVKLLKRLHHSKRQLTQYQEQCLESAESLESSLNTKIRETRNANNKTMQKAKDIKLKAEKTAENIKKNVWHNHMNSLQTLIQRHFNI